MKHKNLHEIAKFGAGIIAADFVFLIWIAQANVLPVEFFGRVLTIDMLLPALVFDAALFFILVHYGWHIGKIPALRERAYLLIAGCVFGIVALLHMARIFANADLSIAGYSLPLWLSWVGVAITAYLSYMSLRLVVKLK